MECILVKRVCILNILSYVLGLLEIWQLLYDDYETEMKAGCWRNNAAQRRRLVGFNEGNISSGNGSMPVRHRVIILSNDDWFLFEQTLKTNVTDIVI